MKIKYILFVLLGALAFGKFAFAGSLASESGSVYVDEWLTTPGTVCKIVALSNTYSVAPKVFASLNHNNSNVSVVHGPVSIWFEDITTTSFRVCALDLEDGWHDPSNIEWIATSL